MPNPDGLPILVTVGLGEAGPTVVNRADDIIDRLNDLKTRLAPLAESWNRSQAAGYYQEQQAKWDQAATALLDPQVGILGDIARALNISYQNSTDAELSNIQTWNNGN
ncbi:WXG100 family type VII secretion target [Streptomyces sp. NBC_01483]|uniref:WXG100 family type VII secretion target n=1 Tax=Streptomyces sp. NBC_01483 TaxID=2903883 RepID=UPI002E373F45|nr:WXG100 family type VII secretion target [Streptomyces sp. NBC_01483]